MNLTDDEVRQRLENGGYMESVAKRDFETIVRTVVSVYRRKYTGIIFAGNTGCGKTLAAMALFPTTHERFVKMALGSVSKCVDAAQLFRLEQRRQVEQLSEDADWAAYLNDGRTVILDDLGADQPHLEYGRQICYVTEFILRRYVEFKRGCCGRLIITTNLRSQDMVMRYGERVVDRLLEMCVICPLKNESQRARPTMETDENTE